MVDNLSNKKCTCEAEAAEDALSYNDYLVEYNKKKNKCKYCHIFVVIPCTHEWDKDGERCVICGEKDWM